LDTPRVVPADGEVDIFASQEKVIESIVQSSVEQVAVEEAPKQLDPIQQKIATVLHGYSNSPAVSRKEVIASIQQLNIPLPGVYVKTLRKAYETFTSNAQVEELLAAIQSISLERERPASIASESKTPVCRENLKLICFDYLWH
ncbi:MAG TPA: helicase, partial [Ktedonobacteraceae bacterium]|nr:helicase [Ktedonobacteraceae bacterium]